jgi:hypothetical protein
MSQTTKPEINITDSYFIQNDEFTDKANIDVFVLSDKYKFTKYICVSNTNGQIGISSDINKNSNKNEIINEPNLTNKSSNINRQLPIEYEIVNVISRNIVCKIYIRCGCQYQKQGCVYPFYLTNYGELISDENTGIIFGSVIGDANLEECKLNNDEYIGKLHELYNIKYKLVGFNKPHIKEYLYNKNIYDYNNQKKYVILESKINSQQLPKSLCILINTLVVSGNPDIKILEKYINNLIPEKKILQLEEEKELWKNKFNNLLIKYKTTNNTYDNDIKLVHLLYKKITKDAETQTD